MIIKGSIHIGNFIYLRSASNTEDTVDDIRLYATGGQYIVEKCITADAAKGGGTWEATGESHDRLHKITSNEDHETEIEHADKVAGWDEEGKPNATPSKQIPSKQIPTKDVDLDAIGRWEDDGEGQIKPKEEKKVDAQHIVNLPDGSNWEDDGEGYIKPKSGDQVKEQHLDIPTKEYTYKHIQQEAVPPVANYTAGDTWTREPEMSKFQLLQVNSTKFWIQTSSPKII